MRLDNSAYDVLRSHKRTNESFSQEIRRILGESEPSLVEFLEILPPAEGALFADAIENARKADLHVGKSPRSRRRRIREGEL